MQIMWVLFRTQTRRQHKQLHLCILETFDQCCFIYRSIAPDLILKHKTAIRPLVMGFVGEITMPAEVDQMWLEGLQGFPQGFQSPVIRHFQHDFAETFLILEGFLYGGLFRFHIHPFGFAQIIGHGTEQKYAQWLRLHGGQCHTDSGVTS